MPDRRLPDGKRDRIVELFNTTKLSNKEIATEVGASERTVYTYRKRYRSTGVAVNPRTGRAPNSGNYKLFPLHDEVCMLSGWGETIVSLVWSQFLGANMFDWWGNRHC
jgi:hypothetical protein